MNVLLKVQKTTVRWHEHFIKKIYIKIFFVAVSVLISLCLYLHTVICAIKRAVTELLLQFYVYSAFHVLSKYL